MLDNTIMQDTIIHRWGTKPKFISFILLVFSFACVKSLALLPVILLITTIIFGLSGVPLQFLLQRLKMPACFILIMGLVMLLFTQGQVVGQLGFLTVTREGAVSALLMMGRFVCILTLMMVLFSTSTFLEVLAVMQAMGIPELLTDMLMFTYRYLNELAVMFRQMNTAMIMRGFTGQKIKALYALSYLAGTIFIRSYEQSQRIYQAMAIRGYGQKCVDKPYREASREDQVLCAMCVVAALVLGSVQFYLLYPGV